MDEKEKAQLNRNIPKMIIIFFLIVVAVDSVMIFLSIKSWRGVIDDESYTNGVNYNKTIRELEEQERLNWHINTEFVSTGKLTGVLHVSVLDGDDNDIENARVKAYFKHSLQEGDDKSFELTNYIEGDYFGDIKVKYPGKWLIKIHIDKNNEHYVHAVNLRIY